MGTILIRPSPTVCNVQSLWGSGDLTTVSDELKLTGQGQSRQRSPSYSRWATGATASIFW